MNTVDDIFDMCDAITDKTQNKNKQMPDDAFKDTFLPYFSGEKKIKDNETIVAKWIEFSGGIHSEIDLVDKAGNVTGTIPPLYTRSDTERSNSANINYGEIAAEYEVIRQRSAPASQTYLANTMSQISDKIACDTVDKSEWDNVMNKITNDDDGVKKFHVKEVDNEIDNYDDLLEE